MIHDLTELCFVIHDVTELFLLYGSRPHRVVFVIHDLTVVFVIHDLTELCLLCDSRPHRVVLTA